MLFVMVTERRIGQIYWFVHPSEIVFSIIILGALECTILSLWSLYYLCLNFFFGTVSAIGSSLENNGDLDLLCCFMCL